MDKSVGKMVSVRMKSGLLITAMVMMFGGTIKLVTPNYIFPIPEGAEILSEV
jgi:hypothetical protein